MSKPHYTIVAVPAGQSSGYKWESAAEAALKEQGKLWQLSTEYLGCSILFSLFSLAHCVIYMAA